MKNRPRKKSQRKSKVLATVEKKDFTGGVTSPRHTRSWVLSGLSADSEIRTHLFELRNRCRDLERNNDYVRGFLADLEENVLGAEGAILQMKIKEESDRVINDPEEKALIQEYEKKQNERRTNIRSRLARRGISKKLLNEVFPEVKLLHRDGDRRAAKVLRGQPDVFANTMFENAWKRFGEKENFTVTKEITRQEAEQLWLRSTARDGACLVRKVRGFDNEFKFALQFIDVDWLDLNYNVVLNNGNEVRMGKEFNRWKQCVAYHVIIREAGDWQWATSNSPAARNSRQRIPAEEIIHGYVRERIDQSREIPWLVAAISRLHMLGKYEEAELVAALLCARKIGVWYSDLFSDQQTLTKDFSQTDKGEFEEATEPGQDTIAPYGWKYELIDPKHPTTTVEQFRRVMLQAISAGLPGSSYHRFSQDPSGLSFSNLRGIELQSREAWMKIQTFSRTNFHSQIFPEFLAASMMSGIVKLPISRIEKFNAPAWIFRRWKGIDPTKEADANKANLLLGITTRTEIAAESSGKDFEEIIEQLIIEEDMLEVAGLEALSLQNLSATKSATPPNPESDGGQPPKKPNEETTQTTNDSSESD